MAPPGWFSPPGGFVYDFSNVKQTAKILKAVQALSQLSYTPKFRPRLQKFLKHICLGLFNVLFSSK